MKTISDWVFWSMILIGMFLVLTHWKGMSALTAVMFGGINTTARTLQGR